MSQTDLKTLDLDLHGQIGLETKKKIVQLLVSATTFEPWEFHLHLELCIDHLKVLHYFKNL